MDDINEINGAIHGDKYDYTVGRYGLYYRWSSGNDKQFGTSNNWGNIFIKEEPISFKSTTKVTGKKKLDFGDRVFETTITEPTGFLRPEFNFVKHLFYNYARNTDEYRNLLNVFSVTEGENIKAETIPLISNYRDTLMNQIQRQIDGIEKINSDIIDVLKVFYYEGKTETLKGYPDEYSSEEADIRGEYFHEKIQQIKSFVDSLIFLGTNSDSIKKSILTEELLEHDYLGKDIIEPTFTGIITLAKQRDPILIVSAKLTSTITALESLLEDIFLNDRVKSNEQYENDLSLNSLPDPKEVAKDFIDRSENKSGYKDHNTLIEAYNITRDYIYNKKVEVLKGTTRTISNEITKALGENFDPKTIDNWVRHYWYQYKPEDKPPKKS